MKFDKTYFKIMLFVFTSILIPALVQFISDEFLNFSFTDNKIVSFLLYCLFFVIATALILLVIRFVRYLLSQKDDYEDTTFEIKNVCKKFNYPYESEVHQMFSLPNSNTVNHDDQIRYEGEKNEKRNNYIYYSFSAKKYLNWIDYIYLNFIKKLKQSLKCKVVICLHYPDKIKECKIEKDFNIDPNSLNTDYLKTCEYFSNLIRKIVDEDVIIKTENQIYMGNIKTYAEDFHNVSVATTLYYAHLIGETDENGEKYTYNNFKRRLSHIESAFPIWMLSKCNKKHGRTFVIDNALSQEIWEMNPLNKIRKSNKIYFIEVTNLRFPNKVRIDVHTKKNVINLTDPIDELVVKLKNTPDEVKQMMICLMDENYLNIKDCNIPSVDDIDNKVLRLFASIADRYKLHDYEQSLEKFKVEEDE